jgi:hypothetical protein
MHVAAQLEEPLSRDVVAIGGRAAGGEDQCEH